MQFPGPGQSVSTWLREGLGWRYRKYRLQLLHLLNIPEMQWGRVVMNRETEKYMGSLNFGSMHAFEISGTKWANFGFATYKSVFYPEYDVCERPYAPESFDVVIAEQVFEHLLWPYRAVRHVWQTLRPGGIFLITTPFLVRVHDFPLDASRWTELGIKYLLAEGGFPLDAIKTGSWGNRACIWANFKRWAQWVPYWHSLRNEPDFPIMVWAFARKPAAG